MNAPRNPELQLTRSRVNQAWLPTLGRDPIGIGPDNRRIFATVQEFNDYCRATGTDLRALAVGNDHFAPIVESGR